MSIDPNITETEFDDRRFRIQTLGRIISKVNRVQFENLIRTSIISGVVDITGWTLQGVEALLKVCADEKLKITIKDETRYFMPVRYPKGPAMESLAKAIVSGDW